MAILNGTEGNDTIIGTTDADTINGLGGNDFLAGDSGDDSIVGGTGNDTIYGDGGNDWLESGAGNDSMSGGGGQDNIVFRELGAANADTIGSFDVNWDRIQLDAAAFADIGASGRFSAGDVRFYSAPGATGGHDADDRIIYNSSTGELFYDADGNGPGAAQLIATFQGAPGITATDINVFGTPTPTPTPTPTGMVINGTDGNDSLVGTAGNDTINGFGGNDTIDGGAGADSMVGGTGDDLYFVDNTGDQVVEFENEGIDEVRSTINYTLPDWVNNLTLIGNAVTGTGNAIDNVITGNALNNVLAGGGGNDMLTGGAGFDSLIGGDGHDTLDGTSGAPTRGEGRAADTAD